MNAVVHETGSVMNDLSSRAVLACLRKRNSAMSRLTLFFSAFLASVSIVAEVPDNVGVRVAVRSTRGAPIRGAYVALIPPYRPWGRPLAERIAPDDGVALFRVPPGSYRVVAVAPDFTSSGAGPITVSGTTNNAVDIRLTPLQPASGTVTDPTGNPVAGARIFVGYAAGPPGLGNFSELHRRAVLDLRSTASGANGAWALPVATDTATPLVVEKQGYVTVARLYRPDQPQTSDFVLQPAAASLRVKLDRTDSGILLTLSHLDDPQSPVPVDWQPKVWGQRPLTPTVAWDGLPPGKYEILAKYTDPRSFAQAYTRLKSIALAAGETAEVTAQLPSPAPPADKVVRLFVPNVPEEQLQHVQAFGVAPTGTPLAVPFSIEEATGGTVVYIDAEAVHAPFYATTADHLISPANPLSDASTGDAPARAVMHSLAAASLHVRSASAETLLPPGGIAIFNGCQNAPDVALPIEILKDGLARLPAPAGCQGAALHFEPFETVAVSTPLRAGTAQSLGDFVLQIAGSADVHVVRQADTALTPVSDAIVTVTVPALRGKPVVVAQEATGADGWVHFSGLPARRDLRVLARTSDSEVAPPASLRVEPRGRVRIDPLALAAPATLVVEPRIDPELRRHFPDAALESVRVQSNDLLSPDEHVAQGYGRDTITLDHLLPGKWQLMAVLKASGTASPLYFDPIELRAGETRRIPLDIKPLIFTGHVVARGHGVHANVYIGGIAGTPSIRRNVVTAPDGAFQVILPARGAYDVMVAKMPSQSFAIPIGQVEFADPAVPVDIALPESRLTVHVHIGDRPANDATVFATLRRDAFGGLDVLQTGTRTNARGDAELALPPGRWAISASSDQSSHSVEKPAVLAADEDARLDIDLSEATATFTGTLRTSSGAPVADALIECVLANGAAPSVAAATTDSEGKFSIDAPVPAPQLARCGATAPDGAIQPFRLSPDTPASVVLAPAPARLAVTWPAAQRGALWLADADGGLVDLTLWMSRSLGSHAFVIPALAPGEWRLVRVASVADWLNLAERGSATTLATVTLAPADDKSINAGTVSGRINAGGFQCRSVYCCLWR
jgi:hypothetical protein